jgi:AcrR family transcriptional regulator
MGSLLPFPSRPDSRGAVELPGDSHHDRRVAEILVHAASVFCEKGYAAASMRDLSRATGISLAGLYYYFDSKERLLFEIQRHAFQAMLDGIRSRLSSINDPEQRIRVFICNHLEYYLANQQSMKVLAHESDALRPALSEGIRAIKRQYYRVCRELVDALKTERQLEFPSRLAVLSLFGMMNWIYTWHNPHVDADPEELARCMGDLFLTGLCGGVSSAAGPGRSHKPIRRKRRAGAASAESNSK